MDDILAPMAGCLIPSYSGSVMYTVAEVRAGAHVMLTSPNRQAPSVLSWADIAQVFARAHAGTPLTPTMVDDILTDPQNRDSSTICALVMAMLDPTRLYRL